jgi:hypothetical protein
MAITQKAAPVFDYVTAYNPVVFAVDSDNKAEAGFRYVFDIYSGGTDVKLAEYLVAPRIGDGYGIVDISRVLQNYVTYDTDFGPIRNSWVGFDVKIGESFSTSWDYDTATQYIQSGSTSNGYTVLSSTQTHPYNVGDVIVVDQFSIVGFPSLEGIQVVRLVPDSFSIVLDLPYTNVTTSSGSTTFANNARLITRDLASYTGYTAFNGVVPFTTKRFPATSYIILNNSTTRKFLTTRPSGTRVRLNQDIFFNCISNYDVFANKIWAQNDAGDTASASISDINEPLLSVRVGPNNLLVDEIEVGTFPIIKSTTKWYDVWLTNSIGNQTSEKIRFFIDRTCAIDYESGEASILFKNRLGSMDSFSFPLRKRIQNEVDRKTFKKSTGFINTVFSPDSWDYSLIDNGDISFYVNQTKTLTLSTNWLTEDEWMYFEELLTSSVTQIKFGNSGSYQNCVIKNSSFETNLQRNKRLFLGTVQVEIANNDNINV